MSYSIGTDAKTGDYYVTKDGRRHRTFASLPAAVGYIATVQEAEALHRRREDRVVSCIRCGSVLGLYIDGEGVPEYAHTCAWSATEEAAG